MNHHEIEDQPKPDKIITEHPDPFKVVGGVVVIAITICLVILGFVLMTDKPKKERTESYIVPARELK
jgi:hypothetical protein